MSPDVGFSADSEFAVYFVRNCSFGINKKRVLKCSKTVSCPIQNFSYGVENETIRCRI